MKNRDSFHLSEVHKENLAIATNVISQDLENSGKAFQNDDSKEPVWKCRYVVTLIGFLVILSASTHRAIMGVVIVAMVNNTAVSHISAEKSESCLNLITNSTEDATLQGVKSEGEFIWSPEIQGYIFGSFFIGNVITLMPASRLAERYGCRWILIGTQLTISILTMMIPTFSRLSASAVIVIQTLRGLVQGMPITCATVLMANWIPKTERGFLFSIIQTAHFLGPALINVFAGYVSELPGGWPYTFYTTGVLGLLLSVYIICFLYENPKEHKRISEAELNFILSQQECKLSRRRPKLPWRQLLTSVPLYALTFGIFGRYWIASQFWTVQSTFLGTILHYPMGQNGLFSATPFFFAFLVAVVASAITGCVEKKEICSVDFLRKFWTVTGNLLCSLCLLGMIMAGCNRDLSVIFSNLSMCLSAVGNIGVMAVLQDMSPTFAGTLYSITSTIGVMASVILPLIAGYLTDKNQTLQQWNKVFFISIGVMMSAAITFAIFGSAKIQPWNFVEEENAEKDEQKPESDNNKEMTHF